MWHPFPILPFPPYVTETFQAYIFVMLLQLLTNTLDLIIEEHSRYKWILIIDLNSEAEPAGFPCHIHFTLIHIIFSWEFDIGFI